jgi:hypothetical protein
MKIGVKSEPRHGRAAPAESTDVHQIHLARAVALFLKRQCDRTAAGLALEYTHCPILKSTDTNDMLVLSAEKGRRERDAPAHAQPAGPEGSPVVFSTHHVPPIQPTKDKHSGPGNPLGSRATRRPRRLRRSTPRSGPAGGGYAPFAFPLCKSGFYGAFVWARRALNRRKRRFPAPRAAACLVHDLVTTVKGH